MGTWDHPSELAHRIGYPSAEKQVPRNEKQLAAFTNERREQPVLSDPGGPKEDDLIFHSLIASDERLALRNPRATFASLIFQCLLLLASALVPLFHVEPLPKVEMPTMVNLQLPMHAGTIAMPVRTSAPSFTRTPARTAIPTPAHTTQDPSPVPAETASQVAAGVVGGVPDGAPADLRRDSSSMPAPAKTPEPAPVRRIRVASRVVEANLIHDVPPQYPSEAGRERIEGTVVLLAVIGTDGAVKDVQLESGPPLLAQAAIDAVKQWRYKPYFMNGVPVEIDSRITINFTMSKG
jgi:protein TonB